MLLQRSELIRAHVGQSLRATDAESSESDLEYPLTPPASDYSDSRERSPENVRQTAITITNPSRKGPNKYPNVLRKRRAAGGPFVAGMAHH